MTDVKITLTCSQDASVLSSRTDCARFRASYCSGPGRKTTLARQIAAQRQPHALYLDLERPADRRRLDDPDAYLRATAGKLVVIDEIHRAPALFETLRGIIDN